MASHCFRMCLLLENGVNDGNSNPPLAFPPTSSLNKHTHFYVNHFSGIPRLTHLALFSHWIVSYCAQPIGILGGKQRVPS